jgi:hypothetical protein
LTADFIQDATSNPNDYASVTAPALAFVASTGFEEFAPGQAAAVNEDANAEMARYFSTVRMPWARRAADRFSREMRGGRVIEISGHHMFFVPDEDLVVAEIRKFLIGRQ